MDMGQAHHIAGGVRFVGSLYFVRQYPRNKAGDYQRFIGVQIGSNGIYICIYTCIPTSSR